MVFGERLKKARERRDLSQSELGEMAGLSQPYISQLEKGGREGDKKHWMRLGQLLGVSGAYLMGETDDPSPLGKIERTTSTSTEWTTQSVRLDRGEKIPVAVIPRRTSACAGNGNGIEAAIEESEDYIDVDRSAFPILDDMRKPFAVYVDGDSMEEMDIPDGAMAVINPAEDVRDGECALVCYKGMWSIKGIRWNKDGSVSLLAGKPQYNMTVPREETEDDLWFSILGKVVEVHWRERPKRFF